MKCIINYLLIFTMLFGTMVWAADSHDEAFVIPTDVVLDQQSTHPQHLNDYEFNDHACHGATHSSAILLSEFALPYTPQPHHIFSYTVAFYSHTQTPPTPPPTA